MIISLINYLIGVIFSFILFFIYNLKYAYKDYILLNELIDWLIISSLSWIMVLRLLYCLSEKIIIFKRK